jgi:hypothetical protein
MGDGESLDTTPTPVEQAAGQRAWEQDVEFQSWYLIEQGEKMWE